MKKLVVSLACLCLFFIACGQTESERGKVKENVEKVYSEINSTENNLEKKRFTMIMDKLLQKKMKKLGKF